MQTPPEIMPDPAARIPSALFAYWWGIFADRWPNQVPALPATHSLYLEMLREELTAGRFDQAARAAFRDSTFFPSPRAVIDYGYGDLQAQAADAWADILRRMAGGHDVLTDEGTRERRILARHGGGQALKQANSYGTESIRGRFIADWIADARAAIKAETRPELPAPAPALDTPAPLVAWSPAGFQKDALTIAVENAKARRGAGGGAK